MLEERFAEKLKEILPADIDTLVVAVSGGADSLALCFLAFEYAMANNLKIYALTVDHSLRDSSKNEANYVHDLLTKHNIKHKILLWQHDGKVNRLHENARKARYNLMCNFCKKIDGKAALLTGHHAYDQTETILMRLLKGSGLKGMIGILEKSYMHHICLLRPLLEENPENLKRYLKYKNCEWMEDPSNENVRFERTRLRGLVKFLKDNKFSIEQVNKSAAKLKIDYEFLEQTIGNYEKYFIINNNPLVVDQVAFLSAPFYVQQEWLRRAILKVGGGDYPKPNETIKAVLKILLAPHVKKYVVGGCIIKVAKKIIYID